MTDTNSLEIRLKSGRNIAVPEFQAYYESNPTIGAITYLNLTKRILEYFQNVEKPVIIADGSSVEIIPKSSIESIKLYH